MSGSLESLGFSSKTGHVNLSEFYMRHYCVEHPASRAGTGLFGDVSIAGGDSPVSPGGERQLRSLMGRKWTRERGRLILSPGWL